MRTNLRMVKNMIAKFYDRKELSLPLREFEDIVAYAYNSSYSDTIISPSLDKIRIHGLYEIYQDDNFISVTSGGGNSLIIEVLLNDVIKTIFNLKDNEFNYIIKDCSYIKITLTEQYKNNGVVEKILDKNKYISITDVKWNLIGILDIIEKCKNANKIQINRCIFENIILYLYGGEKTSGIYKNSTMNIWYPGNVTLDNSYKFLNISSIDEDLKMEISIDNALETLFEEDNRIYNYGISDDYIYIEK